MDACREAPSTAPAYVVLRPGRCWRPSGEPSAHRVRAPLARELSRVLERFAREAGASAQRPIDVELRPGVVGHHQVGRAADIYGVAGVGLAEWKRRWDTALRAAALAPHRDDARVQLARARASNLGWRLYRALQHHGRWAQPYGYPIQLFGPWTRDEGPWRCISDKLLHAHRDHIHVAL